MFKRSVDFMVLRCESMYLLPHLRSLAICSVMETHGRERRVRAYGVNAFREMMLSQGQIVDDTVHPPEPLESGRWADLSFRRFYSTDDKFNRYLDTHNYGDTDTADPGVSVRGRAKGRATETAKPKPPPKTKPMEKKRKEPPPADESDSGTSDSETLSKRKSQTKKKLRYADNAQNRGRPRKYIHVVNEDGRFNRKIIGSVWAKPELPPILIYVASCKKLVAAPPGWSGLGVPPAISEEDIKQGKSPQWYFKFPTKKPAVGSRGRGSDKKKKRKRESGASDTPTRKSKRIKKEVIRHEDGASEVEVRAGMALGGELDELPEDDEAGNIEMSDGLAPAPELRGDAQIGEAGPGPSTTAGWLNGGEPTESELSTDVIAALARLAESGMAEPQSEPQTPGPARRKRGRPPRLISAVSSGNATVEFQVSPSQPAGPTPQPSEQIGVSATVSHSVTAIESPMAATLGTTKKGKGKATRRRNNGEAIIAQALQEERRAGEVRAATVDEAIRAMPDTQIAREDGPPAAPDPSNMVEESNVAMSPRPEGPVTVAPGPTAVAPNTPSASSELPAADTSFKAKPGRKANSPKPPALLISAATASADGPSDFPAVPDSADLALGRGHRKRKSVVFADQTLHDTVPPTVTLSPAGKKRNRPKKDATAETPSEPARSDPHSSSLVIGEGDTQTSIVPLPERDPDEIAFELPSTFREAMETRHRQEFSETRKSEGSQVVERPQSTERIESTVEAQLTTVHSSATSPLINGESSRSVPGTPVAETTSKSGVRIRQPLHRKPRLDIGVVRRANELYQALTEAGGIMTDHKLLIEHREWAVRVVGTDVPFAPPIAAGMDRSVFRRTIAMMLNEGRLKETIVTMPIMTGRWIKANVLYLPETDQTDVQKLIRGLSATTQQAYAPKRLASAKIDATEFTEVRLPSGRPSLGTPTAQGGANAAAAKELSGDDRRAALLTDANVISCLYGWKSGTCLRLLTLHRAIIGALANNPKSPSLVSKAPRIFALPFLLEEITVEEWFACILTNWYDEGLEQFLADRRTRHTRLKDVSRRVRPPGGFNGQGAKKKLLSLLTGLTDLKLVTPLIQVSEEEATVFGGNDDLGTRGFFQPSSIVSMAPHYLVHDNAPIYHIAKDEKPLLHILPVETPEQAEKYWTVLRDACLQFDRGKLSNLDAGETSEPATVTPLTPCFGPSIETLRTLRSLQRWRQDARLLPVQKAALDDAIDMRTGTRLLSEVDLDKLAFDYALSREEVKRQIEKRIEVAKTRAAERKMRELEEVAKAKERQERSDRQLRQKIAERHAQIKRAWEERIRASASRVGVAVGPSLIDFSSRQTLLTSSRAELNDLQLDDIVRLFERSRELGPGENLSRPPRQFPRKVPLLRGRERKAKTLKEYRGECVLM